MMLIRLAPRRQTHLCISMKSGRLFAVFFGCAGRVKPGQIQQNLPLSGVDQ